jgi:hypothetical protein
MPEGRISSAPKSFPKSIAVLPIISLEKGHFKK